MHYAAVYSSVTCNAFEKAGIDPEWAFQNWQNLAEAAAKMTVKENGATVFYGWEQMSAAKAGNTGTRQLTM